MASPISASRPIVKRALRGLLILLVPAWLGMGSKPEVGVRFYAEANARDSERFAKPITFRNPAREGFIEQTPSIHEKMIRAVYPFQARDGSWGCAFRLDANGRINLEVVSTERRGTSLVVFITTKKGVHQVIELLIDKPIRDGIISVPSGLTELEIAAITRAFPLWKQTKG